MMLPAKARRNGPRVGQGTSARMMELIIEQWKNLDGSSQFLWSVWRDGKRIGMSRPQSKCEDAEQQGLDWCLKSTGGLPPGCAT